MRILLHRILLFVLIPVLFQLTAAAASPDPAYKWIKGNSFVQSKNYYLLTLLEELPAVRQLIKKDPVLSTLTAERRKSIQNGLATCARESACYTDKLKFSKEEINLIGERLVQLYGENNPLGQLVKQHLIPSGAYILYQSLFPAEMLRKAWEQDANGVNFTIGVYAEGNKPHYPLIDSISYDTRNGRLSGLIYNTSNMLLQELPDSALFHSIPMHAALRFLEMNERMQAGDDEPMISTVNKPALEKTRKTDWKKYPYSVILIPGAGPDVPFVALSAEGMIRCRLAAVQYRNGMAPFIVVSGGKVHPYKTPYCEATEMKKFMVEQLGIPASAIIVDPHARHTTTNMRNTVRMMFRYGMPMDKPGLTCTTRGQSLMISNTLVERCQRELHITPYKTGKRLSETEFEFFPLLESLQINPEEPMDP
jgi:hypothetical protein